MEDAFTKSEKQFLQDPRPAPRNASLAERVVAASCLSDCLSHPSVVAMRFTVDGAAEDESEQLSLAPSAVEAVERAGSAP